MNARVSNKLRVTTTEAAFNFETVEIHVHRPVLTDAILICSADNTYKRILKCHSKIYFRLKLTMKEILDKNTSRSHLSKDKIT